MIREDIEEIAVCPSCGSPLALYKYTIEGPVESRGKPVVRITIDAECKVCGFRDHKSIYMPVSAAHSLRLLMNSKARLALEKIAIIAELRSGALPG